ncbi:MAG TPA: M48 family metallopeptidase [Mesorhizobium sp.]|uniref:M48 family metallopeptidase n=1 Tax=Mesorhizobium sp. TaxID=1871066 RepID=UPI002DDC98E6|nr:M48 family metallopeptidase [Mesorhizobium sp.]HEV2506902.1 M48 family metallopeptidase [Mesorhizobium sp.]
MRLIAIVLVVVGAVNLPTVALATDAAIQFDVDAATRAYLDTLQGAKRAKSDAYFEGGYWLMLWAAIASVLAKWIILQSGLSTYLRNRAERLAKWQWLVPALYAVPYTIAGAAIIAPWTIYTGYWREKRYGLLSQNLLGWLGEQAIGIAILSAVSALLVTVIFAVIRNSPRYWWAWGAATLTAATMVGTLVAPVFIAPLFNSYTELPAGPVRERIFAIARDYNVPADHIYLFDQSKQDTRISGNVSGLGPTVRISLNDNLLDRADEAEIAAVMGHELGHYVLGHAKQLIGMLALIFVAGFWLIYRLVPIMLSRWGTKWEIRGTSDPAIVPLFSAFAVVFFLVMSPIMNTIIRAQELEADRFGLDAAREPDGFAEIAMKLSEYRKIEPGPVEEFLFFDHPSGATRVKMAMQWKADHMGTADH